MTSVKHLLQRMEALKAQGGNGARLYTQLKYLSQLSLVKQNKYDALLEECVSFVSGALLRDGAVTGGTVSECEKILEAAREDAKSYTIICAAHAHIDMNWMWSYAETVAVTLDTFRTMLNLLKEYPGYTFAQSQASVYRIVEEYDPEMLEEIREMVKQGRWEIIATQWVEADKNMSGGEAQARHILYTKAYMARLFGIDPDTLNIDFEPDTFGHSRFVPETLSNGGIKYYYHMRGKEETDYLYRFRAPSGSEIIVCREPGVYVGAFERNTAWSVPGYCEQYGIKKVLNVFGVGDHGGGPTRKDIEEVLEVNTWPCYPSIRFGTYAEFFAEAERVRDRLPVTERELNCVFTGCYTSQARIKEANKIGENKLTQADFFAAAAKMSGISGYKPIQTEPYWRKILFNQFHDILPGSGVIHTREYALGEFGKALAAANSSISKSASKVMEQMNTSALLPAIETDSGNDRESQSEGGGVGFGITEFGIPSAERGSGINRVWHVFNSSPVCHNGNVKITIWDWPGDISRIGFRNASGEKTAHQILTREKNYWAHSYTEVLVAVEVPAYGFTVVTCEENEPEYSRVEKYKVTERTHPEIAYSFENEKLRVVFNPMTMGISSLIDKQTGAELCPKGQETGIFRKIIEQSNGMSSWVISKYKSIQNLHTNAEIIDICTDANALRQFVKYRLTVDEAKLTVTVSLDKGSGYLGFDAECDWQERGDEKDIPQLNFYVPLAYECNEYIQDVPHGVITRPSWDQDVPTNGLAYAPNKSETGINTGIAVMALTKYGFRCYENSIAVSLIRSSHSPDPYPDCNIHRVQLRVYAVSGETAPAELIAESRSFNNPAFTLPGTFHSGGLASEGTFLRACGEAVISAVKLAEDGSGDIIIRTYEANGKHGKMQIDLAASAESVCFCDIQERPYESVNRPQINGNGISFETEPYTLRTLRVRIAEK